MYWWFYLFGISWLSSISSNGGVWAKYETEIEIEIEIETDPSIVQTNYGTIQGKVTPLARLFTKIPYGKPPIGELRWQNPLPPDPWQGVLMTQEDPPGCVQNCELPWFACPSVAQEDCLYLNVFTPYHPNSNDSSSSSSSSSSNGEGEEDSLYPVMVFIHGGSFEEGYGGGLVYNGTDMANLTDVIVVAINYRLGALGFFWDEALGVMGNYGYMDQVLALDWVYENIAAFGGDPNNIIIYGESAGATSVTLHLLNTSNTYIKGAIMESNPLGVPLRDAKTWGVIPEVFETALGCPKILYSSAQARLDCIKSVNDTKLILFAQQAAIDASAVTEPKYFKDLFMPFTPTIGTGVFSKQPYLAFQSGEFLNVPIITGTNRNESNIAYLSRPIDCQYEYIPFLELTYGKENAKEIVNFYKVPTSGLYDCRNISVHVSTDSIFLCLSRNLTRNAVMYGQNKGMTDVYFYHFNHVSSFSNAVFSDYPDCMYGSGGVCHEAELAYVFRPNLGPINQTYTPEEQQLARMMQWYWGSFSRGKNPNTYASKTNGLNIEWEAYNNTKESTIMFDINQLDMVYNHDTQICDFWDNLGWTWIV